MTQRRIYQCAFPYHITFNILNFEGFFEDIKKAKLLHEIILNACGIKDHNVYQFCIMPDHVHLLCKTKPIIKNPQIGKIDTQPRTSFFTQPRTPFFPQPRTPIFPQPRTLENVLCRGKLEVENTECDCGMEHKYNVSDFIKSIKGTFSRKIHIGRLWQTRFRDEIIHSDKQLYLTINYIINNPIKAELPEKWNKHPYEYKNDKLIKELFK